MVEELQLKMVFWLTEPFSSEERLRLPWRLLLIPLCCSWYSAHGSASLGPEPGNVCPQKSFYSEGPFLPVELHKSFQQQGQGWRPVLDIACKFQLCLFCVWLEEHYFTWVLDFLTCKIGQFRLHGVLCDSDVQSSVESLCTVPGMRSVLWSGGNSCLIQSWFATRTPRPKGVNEEQLAQSSFSLFFSTNLCHSAGCFDKHSLPIGCMMPKEGKKIFVGRLDSLGNEPIRANPSCWHLKMTAEVGKWRSRQGRGCSGSGI